MASFVSLSFSVPYCCLQNPLKLLFPGWICKEISFLIDFQGVATIKTAFYFLAPRISNKGICSVNGEHHLTTPTKHFDEIVSCSLNALQVMELNAAIPWSEPVTATFILKSFYQENVT